MTRQKSNSDGVESSYQLPDRISRRNLLRAGGATAGVAAAGGIPTMTDIEYPVGRADAVLPIGAGYIAAGLLGIGAGVGGTLAYNELFGADASDVADNAGKQSIYNTFDTAVVNNRIAIGRESEKVGVDNSTPPSSPGDNLLTPDDNPHVNEMVSQAYSVAAQEYQEGGSLSEMQQAARQAIKRKSVNAVWTTISTWNTLAKSLASALLLHQQSFDGTTEVIEFNHHTGDNHALVDTDLTGYEMAATTSSGRGCIGVRDLSGGLPIDPSNLTDDEKPENGYQIVEIPYNDPDVGFQTVISPMPANAGNPHTSDPVQATGVLKATYQTSTAKVKVWRYYEVLNAIYTIRDTQLSKIDSSIETLQTELDLGNVATEDFTSAEELYRQFDAPGNVSRQVVELMAEGVYDYSGSKVNVSFSGDSYTGIMFIDVKNSVTVSSGTTISASNHDGGQILLDDEDFEKQVSIPDDVDVSVDGITGDKSEINYTDRKRYTNDSTEVADLRDQIQSQNQQMQELREEIESLENDGPLGGGGSGDLLGTNGLIIGGAALVAAYVLGSD